MLSHVVFFWLEPELTPDQHEAFRKDLDGLMEIPGILRVHTGTPSSTPARPVIDTSYDYALNVIVEGIPGHDAYQDHPIHQAFVARWKPHFKQIRVYDFD